MENVNELYDKPGIIIIGDTVVRTTKIKKWISKKKPEDYKVIYLASPPTDFKDLERSLVKLENDFKGVQTTFKEKETFIQNVPEYEYRLNVNESLKAYNKEQFELLKKWYNVV